MRAYRDAQPVRGLATAAALICIFFILALAIRVGCRDDHGWSPFWPANGAIVVALLVLPKRLGLTVLWIDFLLNMVVNLSYSYKPGVLIFDAALNSGLAFLLAILIRNFCGAATDLSRFRRLTTFMALAIVSSGLEAGVGEVLGAMTRQPDVDFGRWLWWTLCDSLGLIVATPTILLCLQNKRYDKFSHASLVERLALFIVILAVAATAFLQDHSEVYLFLYPLLILMAFRAGPAWVLASVLAVSVAASALTLHGYGPLFGIQPGDARHTQSAMQEFLISLFICAVPVNNALGDMGTAAQRLRRIHATARKARAAAVAANLAKSQFIANVSHEIRTPLNGVLGMAQVLASGDLSDVQRKRVDIIRGSAEVLLGILNDVLDFSKMEAGKLDLDATPFDLEKILHEVQAAFSAIADQKHLTLSLRVEGRPDAVGADQIGAEDLYVGDPMRVRQIVSNLVSNALKFTHAGGVEIVASRLNEGVVVAVRDSGIGIPAAKLPKLFAQFEQVDASTTRRFGGTGLGLSICRDLCRLMGGRISVDSRVGVGSTFTVHLPLARVYACQGPAPQASETASDATTPAAGVPRVLAAEDNEINQMVLVALLEHMGVTPTMVENGARAVEVWQAGQFDLVLMDMQMPVMDGLTAIRAIRAAEAVSTRQRAFIVALTADVMTHQLDDYRLAGVDAVVSKPIQFEELEQAVRTCLRLEPDAYGLVPVTETDASPQAA